MVQADTKSLMDRQTGDEDAIPTCHPTHRSNNKPSFVIPGDVHILRLVPSPQHCLYLLLSTHRHLIKLVEVSSNSLKYCKLLTVGKLSHLLFLRAFYQVYVVPDKDLLRHTHTSSKTEINWV